MASEADQTAERDATGRFLPGYSGAFKPGQSGNPKGRPKAKHRLQTLVRRELEKKSKRKQEGDAEERDLTREHDLAEALVSLAIDGNAAAIKELLKREWPEEQSITLKGDPSAPLGLQHQFAEPTPEQREKLTSAVQDAICGGDDE